MKVVSIMMTYDLSREDWDSIVKLNQFSGQPISNLPSKVNQDALIRYLTE